ncbi:MAG: hypothetical protein KTR32_10805, partial [Granulosicoccus sp.]|nr:hypothetical protein [Granulosicoccus sp.]
MTIQFTGLLVIALVVSACGSSGPQKRERAPTTAEGHVGQLLTATSQGTTGVPLLTAAFQKLDRIEDLNNSLQREAASRNPLTTKQLLAAIGAEIDAPEGFSGASDDTLSSLIEKSFYHVDLAAQAPDASNPIRVTATQISQYQTELRVAVTRIGLL